MSTAQFVRAWATEDGQKTAQDRFTDTFGSTAQVLASAPGRVNLIGEHTDYNGGLCLPIALPHRTFVAARARDDGRVRLVSGSEAATWTVHLDDIAPGTVGGWGAYVAGVAWGLRSEGVPVPGFDAAVASCVPYGAGLSSSAALECATLMALRRIVGEGWNGPDLRTDEGRAWGAQVCVRAENEIAGAPTGGMDQAAALRCSPGHALLLDTRSGRTEQIPFDLAGAGLELLVIDTRAEHSLVDGQYGDRRRSCERAAQILGVQSLREVAGADLDEVLGQLPDDTVRARVRHVVTEINRVEQFVALLRAGAWEQVGSVMDASHDSLAKDYEVSAPELDTAVQSARAAGALGARMTGGGFGGSAIALIPRGHAAQVASAVTAAFDLAGHARPAFLVAEAAAAAH